MKLTLEVTSTSIDAGPPWYKVSLPNSDICGEGRSIAIALEILGMTLFRDHQSIDWRKYLETDPTTTEENQDPKVLLCGWCGKEALHLNGISPALEPGGFLVCDKCLQRESIVPSNKQSSTDPED